MMRNQLQNELLSLRFHKDFDYVSLHGRDLNIELSEEEKSINADSHNTPEIELKVSAQSFESLKRLHNERFHKIELNDRLIVSYVNDLLIDSGIKAELLAKESYMKKDRQFMIKFGLFIADLLSESLMRTHFLSQLSFATELKSASANQWKLCMMPVFFHLISFSITKGMRSLGWSTGIIQSTLFSHSIDSFLLDTRLLAEAACFQKAAILCNSESLTDGSQCLDEAAALCGSELSSRYIMYPIASLALAGLTHKVRYQCRSRGYPGVATVIPFLSLISIGAIFHAFFEKDYTTSMTLSMIFMLRTLISSVLNMDTLSVHAFKAEELADAKAANKFYSQFSVKNTASTDSHYYSITRGFDQAKGYIRSCASSMFASSNLNEFKAVIKEYKALCGEQENELEGINRSIESLNQGYSRLIRESGAKIQAMNKILSTSCGHRDDKATAQFEESQRRLATLKDKLLHYPVLPESSRNCDVSTIRSTMQNRINHHAEIKEAIRTELEGLQAYLDESTAEIRTTFSASVSHHA